MANMGLDSLILVEPAVKIGNTARAFAVRAQHILDRAQRFDSLESAVADHSRIVGTSSTRDRSFPHLPIPPRDLPEVLAADSSGTPTAIVFGSEVSGLNNNELAQCYPHVRIPSCSDQPTLNLGQAVLVVTYELYLARQASAQQMFPAEPLATSSEIAGLFRHVVELLSAIGFDRDDTFAGVRRDLRQLAARAALQEREVKILRGICRRALRAVSQPADDPAGKKQPESP
jgi:TrmH family RNA methyltransferase